MALSETEKNDNTSLFQFEFTDRQNEQVILQNFLHNQTSNVLWVYGKSGTGKTFFINNCIQKGNVIYVENKENNEPGSCILNLINQLHKLGNDSFWSFIQNHYKNIKAFAKDIPGIKTLTESNFGQFALSKNFFLVDQQNEFNNLPVILKKYMEHVLKEATLIFIIDNFDQCDGRSVEILLDFVKYNNKNQNRKFIFISTDKDSGLSENEAKLEQEIPCKKLEISIIPNETYFINMLPASFDTSNLNEDFINKIYQICNGLPEKLKDLLMNLDKANAIEYLDKKIKFNLTEMEKYILSNTSCNLDISSFPPIEQCLLLTVICIGVPLHSSLLINISQILYKNLFNFSCAESKFDEALQQMFPKPLSIVFNDTTGLIYTDHDLTFEYALAYFKQINIYNLACDKIYDYLGQNMSEKLLVNFSESACKELFANLAYNSECSNWKKVNLECGKYFYSKQNYIQAIKYFNRLLEFLNVISARDKLFFIIAYYEVGFYKEAYDILLKISDVSVIESYEYYIYAGKTLNMNRNYEQAAYNFKKAISLAEDNTNKKMYAEYMLHIILTQIPGQWNEAKNIYKSLVTFIKKAYSDDNKKLFYQTSNAKILKCCYNFFFNQEALDLMEMAEEIAERCQMVIEKAFILNNKGFEYVRQDNNKKGIECFKRAYDILLKTKPHEAAYALNNIGICYMFNKNYSMAILTFKDVLLFQKSYYVKLTAKTMLMQCYSLSQREEAEQLFCELSTWVDQHPNEDPAIIRKICMNLAIYEKQNKMYSTANAYINKINDSIENTSSEYRALKLKKELQKIDVDFENKQYIFNKSKYFNLLEFEPWFITLSHD